jgi:hypothetical protein
MWWFLEKRGGVVANRAGGYIIKEALVLRRIWFGDMASAGHLRGEIEINETLNGQGKRSKDTIFIHQIQAIDLGMFILTGILVSFQPVHKGDCIGVALLAQYSCVEALVAVSPGCKPMFR